MLRRERGNDISNIICTFCRYLFLKSSSLDRKIQDIGLIKYVLTYIDKITLFTKKESIIFYTVDGKKELVILENE